MYSPEARSARAVPWLFDGYGLSLLLTATAIGLLTGANQVAFLAGALFVLGVVSRLWSRGSLGRLRYARSISPVRAFPGDSVTLETTLANRKLLPLPWIEAWEWLPGGLRPPADTEPATGRLERSERESSQPAGGWRHGQPSQVPQAAPETEPSQSRPGWRWLCQGAVLWPYQRARWRHRLVCDRRGVFSLGDVAVRSGDPFGMCERQGWLHATQEIVVYPRVVPLRRLALPLRHPAVDAASRRGLVQDPLRTAGIREYRPGDPLRLVHWRASAHAGALQVRVLEHATSQHVWLVVEAGSFDLPWTLYRDNLFELTLSAVASIGMFLHQAGHPVGLMVRGSPTRTLPPSAHPAQLAALLELLARAQPHESADSSVADFAPIARGSSVVLAACESAEGLADTIRRLEQGGAHVVPVVAMGGWHSDPLAGRAAIRLRVGENLSIVLEGGT